MANDARRSWGRRARELVLGSLVIMSAVSSGWIVSDLWASIAGAPAVSPDPTPRLRTRPSSRRDRRIVPASFEVVREAPVR